MSDLIGVVPLSITVSRGDRELVRLTLGRSWLVAGRALSTIVCRWRDRAAVSVRRTVNSDGLVLPDSQPVHEFKP